MVAAGRVAGGGVWLLSDLDHHAASVFDLDVQTVPVQQPHANKWCGVGHVGIDAPRPVVPEGYGFVDAPKLTTLPSASIADALVKNGSPRSVTNVGGNDTNPVKPVSITASICRV